MEGNFARDPYWVEGTWKDALTAFLLPLDRQAPTCWPVAPRRPTRCCSRTARGPMTATAWR